MRDERRSLLEYMERVYLTCHPLLVFGITVVVVLMFRFCILSLVIYPALSYLVFLPVAPSLSSFFAGYYWLPRKRRLSCVFCLMLCISTYLHFIINKPVAHLISSHLHVVGPPPRGGPRRWAHLPGSPTCLNLSFAWIPPLMGTLPYLDPSKQNLILSSEKKPSLET